MSKPETIKVDDVEYVRKDTVINLPDAKKLDGMDYVIVRTYSAGVFAGYLESRKDKEVVMRNARRLWYWSGASSLSQLSVDGVARPNDCKFPCEVAEVTLTEAIEILPCTEKAQKSIAEVKVWEQ